MPVIHERMPAGIPGDVSRKAGAVIEPAVTGSVIPFGSPVQLDAAGKITGPTAAANPVYGFLVRPYPTQSATPAQDAPGASGTAAAGTVADVLRSGYMTVRLSSAEGGKPVKGTPVKAVFEVAGSFNVGEIALSQGTVIPRCFFMGEADGAGNVEISFNV